MQSHDDPKVVREVKLSPEKEKQYVQHLISEIDQALDDREDLEKTWETAIQQYHSNLLRDDIDPEDSHIDIPTSRQFVEAAIARYMVPIFQRRRPYAAIPSEPECREFAAALENFVHNKLEYGEHRLFVEDILRGSFVYSKAVAKNVWRLKTKKVKHYYHEQRLDDGSLEEHWGVKDAENLKVKDRFVTAWEGCKPEVVPTPDFIHPIPTASIESAPWVSHRTWMTKDEIKRLIKRGVFRAKAIGEDGAEEDILKAIGEPAGQRQDNLLLSQQLRDKKEGEEDGGERRFYEVHEVYSTLDEDEVMLTIERKSGVVFRFIENFNFEDPRPFTVYSYERALNDIDGISLCYILEPYHRAISASYNQRLDAASRALELMVFAQQSLDAGKYFKNGRLKSGFFTVNSAGDLTKQIVKFNLSQPFDQMEKLEDELKRDAQKLAGLNDYNAGIEQIDRPTATGQMALLEEGRQPGYNRLESFRGFLRDTMMMVVSRYRQWHPVGVTYYLETRDPAEAEAIQQVLTWPTEYWRDMVIVEPAVSSQTMSQDMRKQEWLALVDKFQEIFKFLMEMTQLTTQMGPVGVVAGKLIEFYTKQVLQPWMDEWSVAGKEFLDLGEELNLGQMLAEALAQMQAQAQAMAERGAQQDAAIAELTRTVDHLAKSYMRATGKVPIPPAPGPQATGPSEAAGGVEGGTAVPGGAGA